jgi:hypothetical protein
MKAIQYRGLGGFADCSRIESSMRDGGRFLAANRSGDLVFT